MDDLLKSGDYARKQLYCPSGLVRWSHGSRFELARALAAARAVDAGAVAREHPDDIPGAVRRARLAAIAALQPPTGH